MSEKVEFELGVAFDDKNFKSCFARSVAVNSQYGNKQAKSLDFKSLQENLIKNHNINNASNNVSELKKPEIHQHQSEMVRLRKNYRMNGNNSTNGSSIDENRRLSCGSLNNSIRRSSFANRLSEVPVQSIVHQSKIETLQWQLKEVEKSREMYKAVMKQVVTFLEKAHQSLEQMGSRINSKTVPRSRSDHHIVLESNKCDTFSPSSTTIEDYITFGDYTWNRLKKAEKKDDVPPEKLAQEAFRLLRTAQSLLSTREPKLSNTESKEDDYEFLSTLAKEFPTPEHKPQRTTSFSLSPKLIVPENDIKISTAFNRKLSLQLSEVRRNSFTTNMKLKSISNSCNNNNDSARGSVAESEPEAFLPPFKSANKEMEEPSGSVSSVEDESGFSSMNSFQDVGLPLVNSTMIDEVNTKNALLRSMLHNNSSSFNQSSYSENTTICPNNNNNNNINNIMCEKIEEARNCTAEKLMVQKADAVVAHKRWHSTPVDENATNTQMKVLWV